MRLTDLTATIQEHAKVSQGDAEAIAKGLIERGLVQADVPVEPRPCECCGKLFNPDRRTARFCSNECVSLFQHL